MVRSHWMGPVLLGVAWTGLAWGQPSPYAPSAVGQPRERIITVQELGKPGQRCKVLKTWREPDGAKAYLVQALEGTGEFITIVESGPMAAPGAPTSSRIKAVATRLFHWGLGNTPPAGSPEPPPHAAVLAEPNPRPQLPAPKPRTDRQPAPPPYFPTENQPKIWAPAYASRPPGAPTSEPPAVAPNDGRPVTLVPARTPTPLVPRTQPRPTASRTPAAQGPARTVAAATVRPPAKPATPAPKWTTRPPAPALPAKAPVAQTPAARVPALSARRPAATASPSVASRPATPTGAKKPSSMWASGGRQAPVPPKAAAGPRPALAGTVQRPAVPAAVTRPEVKPVPLPVVVKRPEIKPVPPAPRTSAAPVIVGQTPLPRRPAREPVILTQASQPRIVPVATGTAVKPAAGSSACEVCATCAPPPRQSLLGRIFRPNPPPRPAPSAAPAAKPPADAVAQVALQPIRTDWRGGWGKDRSSNTTGAGQTEPLAPARTAWSARPELPHADANKPDPFTDPANYSLPAPTPAPPPARAVARAAPAPRPSHTTQPPRPIAPALAAARPTPPPAAATGRGDVPPGMGSVVAVRSQELASTHPPAAPPPKSAAKTPPGAGGVSVAAEEGNAFTEPKPKQDPPKTPPEMMNAFSPSTPPQQPDDPHGASPPPNFPAPPRLPMPPMPPPMPPMPPARPMVPIDSGVPSGMANAFTAAGSARPIPADFGPPHHPGNAFTTESDEMVADARAMMSAPGPQPGMRPAPGAPGRMNYGRPPAAPTAPVAVAPESMTTSQLLAQLHDSLYPSEREVAAEHLSYQDWRTDPGVVAGLLAGARSDPAPMVRAACVRGLARMRVNTPSVVSALQSLQADADADVRQEVDQALTTLQARRAENAVQAAGYSGK